MDFFGKEFSTAGSGPWKWSVEEDGIVIRKKKFGFDELPQAPVIHRAPITPLDYGSVFVYLPGKYGKKQLLFALRDNTAAMAAIDYVKQKCDEIASGGKGAVFNYMDRTGSRLCVYEDYLTIELVRTRFVALDSGSMGAKRINFSDITSITFRNPTDLTVGFVQFSYPGSIEAGGRSVADVVNDENSILVEAKDVEFIRKVVDYVEERRAALKNGGGATVQASPADELRKFKGLLDDGIITQEEFDAKKKQILGL